MNINEEIYIFGHITPDTDSVCSSIAYSNLKNKLGYKNAKAYRVGKLNKETEFVLKYFNVEQPPLLLNKELSDGEQKNIILIDHNERSQCLKGVENSRILEIIDHHRFSDLHTNEPLFIRAEPVGCTGTIIAKMYKENSIDFEYNIAGILLSAILSDTLIFTSPTCTEIDKVIGAELAKITNIDCDEYGNEMFKASTNLDDFSCDEILAIDRKKFSFGEYTAFISQVNTMDYKSLHSRKEELILYMEKHATKNNSDLNLLMVTDIPLGGSEIIAVGHQKKVAQNMFNMNEKENSIYVSGLVSRKKQVVPLLPN